MPSRKTVYHDFLCACLRSDGASAGALAETTDWKWEQVINEASQHSILPSVSSALQARIGVEPPLDILDFFSAVAVLNHERNASFLAEIETVSGLLNQIGIEPVLLKGSAYLTAGLYSDPGARYLGDIDMLVSREDIEPAVAALTSYGFVRDDSDRFGRFRHHHPPLRRIAQQGPPIWIELHHSVGVGACELLLPTRDLISRSLAFDLKSARVRIPCPEHLATHLIVHSQMLHPYNERIWPPLRALYDLHCLQNRFGESINWPKICSRFRSSRQYGVLALHLRDAQDTLGIGVPVDLRLLGFNRLRWYRRRLIRRWPTIRYFDPKYMLSVLCTRRLRIVSTVLRKPREWKYFVSQLCRTDVYLRFVTDVVEGRGR